MCTTGGILDAVLPAFTGDSNLHCRSHYFDILRHAWQLHEQLRLRLRPPLLALLGDPDPELRTKVLTLDVGILYLAIHTSQGAVLVQVLGCL